MIHFNGYGIRRAFSHWCFQEIIEFNKKKLFTFRQWYYYLNYKQFVCNTQAVLQFLVCIFILHRQFTISVPFKFFEARYRLRSLTIHIIQSPFILFYPIPFTSISIQSLFFYFLQHIITISIDSPPWYSYVVFGLVVLFHSLLFVFLAVWYVNKE